MGKRRETKGILQSLLGEQLDSCSVSKIEARRRKTFWRAAVHDLKAFLIPH